jgi:hypothetical protein
VKCTKRSSDTLYRRFANVVGEVDGWMSIDEFLGLCDEHEVFDDAAQAEMVTQFKKAEIRKMLRRMAKHPPAGGGAMVRKIEWVNLIIQTADGRAQNVYKQLDLFDAGDFVQVIRERMSRVSYWNSEVQRLVTVAVEKFGARIQDMLPFHEGNPPGGTAYPTV